MRSYHVFAFVPALSLGCSVSVDGDCHRGGESIPQGGPFYDAAGSFDFSEAIEVLPGETYRQFFDAPKGSTVTHIEVRIVPSPMSRAATGPKLRRYRYPHLTGPGDIEMLGQADDPAWGTEVYPKAHSFGLSCMQLDTERNSFLNLIEYQHESGPSALPGRLYRATLSVDRAE